jgi:hypothetical protein
MKPKSHLEFWMSFPRDKLAEAVEAESRRGKLSFENQQRLDAATERLLKWRRPLERRGSNMKIDDTETAAAPEPSAPEPTGKATKKTKRSAPVKVAKEDEMAKKAKTKGKAKAKSAKTAKAEPKTKKASGGNGRIPADAKIVAVKGVEVPFREGSGAHERTMLVIKNSGKTREQIEKLKEIKTTTIPTLVSLGVVRVA